MAQSNAGVAAICNAKQTSPDFPVKVPPVVNFTPPTIGDWSSVIQAILQLQWALIPIVNPDDDSQFVIVRRTVTQSFKNPATGETLTINNPDG